MKEPYAGYKRKLIRLHKKVRPKVTYREIADELGVPGYTLMRHIHKLQKTGEIEARRTTTISPLKVNRKRLAALVKARQRGVTYRELGEWYGISEQAVWQFVDYHTF
jgi:predicted transcriptional regulator